MSKERGTESAAVLPCTPRHVISLCSSAQCSWSSPAAAIHKAAALMPLAADMNQVQDNAH